MASAARNRRHRLGHPLSDLLRLRLQRRPRPPPIRRRRKMYASVSLTARLTPGRARYGIHRSFQTITSPCPSTDHSSVLGVPALCRKCRAAHVRTATRSTSPAGGGGHETSQASGARASRGLMELPALLRLSPVHLRDLILKKAPLSAICALACTCTHLRDTIHRDKHLWHDLFTQRFPGTLAMVEGLKGLRDWRERFITLHLLTCHFVRKFGLENSLYGDPVIDRAHWGGPHDDMIAYFQTPCTKAFGHSPAAPSCIVPRAPATTRRHHWSGSCPSWCAHRLSVRTQASWCCACSSTRTSWSSSRCSRCKPR